jgi:hypothetical protein
MPDSWVEDGSIPDHYRIWRAIPSESLYPLGAGKSLADQDFSDSAFRSHEVSFYIIDETTPEALAAKPQFKGLRFREISAAVARSFGLILVREIDQDGDTSHIVAGRQDAPGKRLSGGQAANLKKASKWADSGPGKFPPTQP